ncbi:hypothetical protein [Cellulomonas sp. URHE0023]|uniref:hypothetical protein n=1 Tax=Cellulomonas sp. URHE0023 TaxID=1380354 RepID=UPI0012DC262E|nr:hypothetical protein [Cellulomonas sp. URHE0023]
MASSTSKKSRKGLAIGLAILGLAGLSLASASALNLAGTPQLQAGVKDVAGCQTTDIAVAFTAPQIVSGAYTSTSVTLTKFDGPCFTAGAQYQVAFLDSNGAKVQETIATTVPNNAAATVNLTTATAANIAKVAVTIYK